MPQPAERVDDATAEALAERIRPLIQGQPTFEALQGLAVAVSRILIATAPSYDDAGLVVDDISLFIREQLKLANNAHGFPCPDHYTAPRRH
jgi:hypothetical protein